MDGVEKQSVWSFVIMRLKNLRLLIPTLCALFITATAVTDALAGVVYRTSVGVSDSQLWKYDTDTNVWTRLNDFNTGSTFAVSNTGEVFAYSGGRNAILKYNPGSDTWSHHMDAPFVGGAHHSSSYNFFNLEVTNEGRFLLTGNRQNNLYYSDGGGVWGSTDLGFSANTNGDYDPTTGQYAISDYFGRNPVLIDTQTFAQTVFTGTGNGGEWQRSGSILNGVYYNHPSSNPIEAWDLSNPLAGPTFINRPANNFYYMASAADRANDLLYMADIWTGAFYSYDGASMTQLASTPSGANHSTIAFVGDIAVPAPGALALLGLGLFGLGWRRRTA